jgi:hypothetical protein
MTYCGLRRLVEVHEELPQMCHVISSKGDQHVVQHRRRRGPDQTITIWSSGRAGRSKKRLDTFDAHNSDITQEEGARPAYLVGVMANCLGTICNWLDPAHCFYDSGVTHVDCALSAPVRLLAPADGHAQSPAVPQSMRYLVEHTSIVHTRARNRTSGQ